MISDLERQKRLISEHQKNDPVQVDLIADKLGIKVYRAIRFPDTLSGVIRRNPDEPDTYAIYVNGKHGENRQRFTIAHEIGHFVLHRELIGDGIADDVLYRSGISNRAEAQANRFAANLLMPWHLLDPLLAEGIVSVPELANRFQVSDSAMAIRLGVPYER